MTQFDRNESTGMTKDNREQAPALSPIEDTPKAAVSFSFRSLALAERAPALVIRSHIKAGLKLQ